MIDRSTFEFLKDLKLNNSKDWLDGHRKIYEQAKENILTFTGELIDAFSNLESSISSAHLDPKKCITRLNRDLRFAKDKTPYKTDYYIVLNKNGKNSPSAFYYLHIEPKNCFVGGGVYNPQPDHLKKIRQEIDYAFSEWKEIINNESFTKVFPSGINHSGVLSRPPKDFDADNEAVEFLKMKGFYTSEKLSDEELTSNDTFTKIISSFQIAKPLVNFLNRAIEND
ncbi:DUF2461 domain-containing protein [Pedobacter changchengzhani]|uniref:DUF2461 domain-containing protein n=1 Tax=Pedobacter changchengzhani TaxID=2529274 RepID=A0A4R5MMC9_9SPHI|nr:DUF2461 domain-containing protein [Pedobacter changchengzhani]TDG36822.1 DUF2461 domain-containing protein [Pedobacter changchengzhani]